MTTREADLRAAHAWATAELATARPTSIREYVLREERKRLAGLVQALREGARGPLPYPERRAMYLAAKGAGA